MAITDGEGRRGRGRCGGRDEPAARAAGTLVPVHPWTRVESAGGTPTGLIGRPARPGHPVRSSGMTIGSVTDGSQEFSVCARYRGCVTGKLSEWLSTSARPDSVCSLWSERCCSAWSAHVCGSCRPSSRRPCRSRSSRRSVAQVPLLPERGRIFDAEGRILADNERVLTVGVDWDFVRRDDDRAEMFRRLSGWVDVPVEEMEASYQSGIYEKLSCRSRSPRTSTSRPAIAIRERVEDFPGVTDPRTLPTCVPVRAAGQPCRRLHGSHHRRDARTPTSIGAIN